MSLVPCFHYPLRSEIIFLSTPPRPENRTSEPFLPTLWLMENVISVIQISPYPGSVRLTGPSLILIDRVTLRTIGEDCHSGMASLFTFQSHVADALGRRRRRVLFFLLFPFLFAIFTSDSSEGNGNLNEIRLFAVI